MRESADFAAFPTDHRETGRDQPIAEPGAEGGTVSISVGAVRLFNVTRMEVTPGYSVAQPQGNFTMEGTIAMNARTTTSKPATLTSRIISGLIILFLLVDAVPKLLRLDFAVDATVDLGYLDGTVVWIGLILLVSTVLYTIPRTAILGAVLLTGYFGGAIATQMRLGEDAWLLFPFVIGVLAWAGLYLRDDRVRELVSV